ncbi:DNA-directed RNA polymerase subunit delta [Ureaplasma ceti]|uniref:RNAP delta factor n=1 Tax=Ureaplasma ceti TaxID=3119530 RepID=A0ABP9U6I7_9BACT
MLSRDLIDIAYECVESYFTKHKIKNDETITFEKIVELTCKAAGISQKDFEAMVGSFYADLMQDGRFVFLGENKWNLKDRITMKEYKKNLNTLYEYEKTVSEEEYDDDSLPEDMKDEKEEVYEEDENEISRDSIDEASEEDEEMDDDENEVVRRTIENTKNREDEDDDF